MRQAARSVEVAECAVRWRDAGVVGFDVAGPEKGYPADPLPRRLRIHPARELPHHDPRRRVVRAAVDLGGAPVRRRRAPRPRRPDRRRHHGPRPTARSSSAGWPRSSATGASRSRCARPRTSTPAPRASIAEHPIDLLRRLRFRVTLNTDNRLMSGVSLSSEFAALDEAFGIGLGEMEWLTINALKSAFAPFDERLRLINEVVKPGYAHLRAEEARVVVGVRPRDDPRWPAGPKLTPEGHPRGHPAHPQDRSRVRAQRLRAVHRAAPLPLPRAARQRGMGRVHAVSRGAAGSSTTSPAERDLAIETVRDLGPPVRAPPLLLLGRRPVPPLDAGVPARPARRRRGLRLARGAARAARLPPRPVHAPRRDVRGGARRSGSRSPASPIQYDDLDRRSSTNRTCSARLAAAPRDCPVLELDMSNGDLDRACAAIADWMTVDRRVLGIPVDLVPRADVGRTVSRSSAGSATTKRDPPKPLASMKIRPPIAFIRRRAGEQADPGAAAPAAALDPDERLEDALPVLDRDARAVVGDVDLDLVADPPDADAHALGRRRVLRFVLEQLLEDLAEPRLVADRDQRPGRALPADGARPQQEAQRLDRLVDRLDGVERRPRQPGQALAADRGEDRIDEPVEPAELLDGGVVPVVGSAASAAPAGRRRPPRPAGRRRPARPTAASAARGSRRSGARPAPRRARSARPAGPRPRPSAGPSRRSRPAAPRSSGGRRSRPSSNRRASRVWTLSTPTTPSCQTSGTDSIAGQPLDVEAADPGEAVVLRDVVDRDRRARGGHPAGDPLAPGEADLADLRAVEAVRRGQGQARPLVVGEVERADLDAHRRPSCRPRSSASARPSRAPASPAGRSRGGRRVRRASVTRIVVVGSRRSAADERRDLVAEGDEVVVLGREGPELLLPGEGQAEERRGPRRGRRASAWKQARL